MIRGVSPEDHFAPAQNRYLVGKALYLVELVADKDDRKFPLIRFNSAMSSSVSWGVRALVGSSRMRN
jgi:hypothetical protein